MHALQEYNAASEQYKILCIIRYVHLFVSLFFQRRQPIPLFYGHFEEIVHYSHGEIYKFSHIVTQTGSGSYNTADGKYTCGVTGYYLVSVMLFGGGELFVTMIKLAKHIFHFSDKAQN